jgi:hypothetical protein
MQRKWPGKEVVQRMLRAPLRVLAAEDSPSEVGAFLDPRLVQGYPLARLAAFEALTLVALLKRGA